jgi:hypothetical protein
MKVFKRITWRRSDHATKRVLWKFCSLLADLHASGGRGEERRRGVIVAHKL